MSYIEPPESLKIGPYTYKLFMAVPPFPDPEDSCEEDVGKTYHHKQTIYVDCSQASDMMADTVLHEVLHCLWGLTSLSIEWSEKKEERYTRLLSPILLDVMRSNPQLVDYLMQRKTDEV